MIVMRCESGFGDRNYRLFCRLKENFSSIDNFDGYQVTWHAPSNFDRIVGKCKSYSAYEARIADHVEREVVRNILDNMPAGLLAHISSIKVS